ncbi:HlyC/CorC family transporter [Faecalimonas umbilicata]|uniref:HlyC/CorC family transporter n=1 Tax=Faecalimonas umbilicata TaxID=1912855 RepID=UPI0022DECEEA|nr:hemolysin family protein [Faecalimonas umbilicata]
MDSSVVIQLIILAILILLSALFSSAETSLTTSNKLKIQSLADQGSKRARILLRISEDSGKMLSAILIGNNLVNNAATALTTSLIIQLFGNSAVGIATGVITLLILIFGEISPKTLATIHSEKMALLYAPLIHFLMKIFTPVIFIVNKLSMGVLFLLRVNPDQKVNTMTEHELRTIVDVSHEDGVIESEEKEMIYNVFDMGDAKAKDIMVPRVHVTFADINSTYDELIEIFREDKFTRLPIYEETTDNVVGTINMKDLLLYNYNDKKEFHVRDILREAYFTYEYKSISELLVEMRQASINIAIVLDEYGETAGLITLEDLLEEIVGEIHDEYDENEEEFVRQINDREYIIEGSMNLDDLNDSLGLNLSSEDYDSLGGFIIEHLDRLPEQGDELTTDDGIRLVVEALQKNRVESVHLYIPEGFYDRKEEDSFDF